MIHVEDDAINRDYYSGRRIEFNRTEKYWLAASFEHELEGRLTVRGGAEARYEQTKTSACQIDGHDSFWRDETETRESIGYGFSWGAGYTWRMFELNGMARTDLDLTSLFVALDARIRL